MILHVFFHRVEHVASGHLSQLHQIQPDPIFMVCKCTFTSFTFGPNNLCCPGLLVHPSVWEKWLGAEVWGYMRWDGHVSYVVVLFKLFLS